MRLLLAATCLTPIAWSSAALADTTISGSSTANLRTSTAASGSPDNIVIASGATVAPASGTAVTIDSNNSVSNAGTIQTTDVNGITGIGGGGYSSSITNTGTISISESYTQTDTNGDGVVDGAFAQGSNRYGINVTGSGAFTGTITNSGTITIKGNNSGGIIVATPLVGTFTNNGAVSVGGDNGVGISLGQVTGNVTLASSTGVTGQNSAGVILSGDISGRLVIHGALSSSGYTSNTLPATTTSLTSANLLQGGSALTIAGSVAGGVLMATTTSSTDTTLDADGDGLADTSEGTGSATTYGSAPAVVIGSATQGITLGPVASGGGGLVLQGAISASGVYSGVSATGVRIGGLGQSVTISGGITNTGTITAASNGSNATALLLGSGTATPSLLNSGTISASSTTTGGGTVSGVLIDSGASLPTITNSGTISATPATTSDTGTAILDRSGTLTSVGNTGTISAGASSDTRRAIDVSANTSGFSYVQSQSTASTTTTPTLYGAIVTGSGNDSLTISAGTVTSAISTGAGDDSLSLSGTSTLTGSAAFGSGTNTLTLADTAKFTGNADFGGGAGTLAIGGTAAFSGQLLNSGAVAASVSGGTLALTNTGSVALASLTLANATLGVTINPASGAYTQLNVAGATTISGASTLNVTVSSLAQGATSYTVLRSGTLSGSSNLGLTITGLPYLLSGSLAGGDASGALAVSIRPKTATELALTKSESAAYGAVYADIAGSSQLSGLFLGFTDRASLIERYRQMLPDHAGGVFDILYTGARTLAPSESVTPWAQVGGLALWAQQGYWNATQKSVDTPGYHGTGYGLSAGGDIALGPVGRIGLTIAYTYGDITDQVDNAVNAHQFTGGAYWRGDWGGFHIAASGGAGIVALSSRRALTTLSTNQPELLSNSADWNGLVLQGSGRVSYELHAGAFYARPAGTISYFRLHEKAHDESGGGAAYDLSVAARTSDELAATGTLALGVQFGGKSADPDATSVRFELEGGRRSVISSALGATTAHFSGGQDFTLLPEDRESGWLGTASLSIGSSNFRVVASGTGETRNGYRDVLGRIAIRGVF